MTKQYPNKIAATGGTFSSKEYLVSTLKETFPNCILNNTGKRYSFQELINVLKEVEGAIIGADIIDESVLEKCPNLKIISNYGVGLDNLDLAACAKYSVTIKNKEGVNKRSVAELTLGLMSGLMRNWYQTSLKLKENSWDKAGGRNLSKKTIGIIGVGNVGKEIVKLLKPYECEILVNDIRQDEEQKSFYQENNLKEVSKDEIYKKADIISLHIPLTNLTQNLINKEVFEMMNSTSFIINTARSEIINEDDLFFALKNSIIAGGALDVYKTENPPENKELLKLRNLICTPHIGGNSNESILAMGYASVNGLKDFFENGS
ncbi:phosphoglycerate dehydrogenase [Candidatus Pacearchaeota archaeon]|nr:phosphoglycerate dehydrogenase [Candidatus Pacearchaeota archaeon]